MYLQIKLHAKFDDHLELSGSLPRATTEAGI